jgi:glutamine amidotransferase
VIAVLDYGIGNLRSAEKALQHVGADARLVADPAEAAEAVAMVLPGVGAFGACAEALRRSGLDRVALQAIERGIPFLGICVGLQLLFPASDEDPGARGLGVLEGHVRPLSPGVRRPQMQWNLTRPTARESGLLGGGAEWFYFVHSYVPEPSGDAAAAVVGTCDYGGELAVAFESGNVFGTQFHPEKSARNGLDLLGRFAALAA